MCLRYLEFLLQETFTGIRRNAFMSVAAVTTIAVSLLLLGSLGLATANLNQVSQSLCERFEMRVFLRVPISRDERDRLSKGIASLPGVKECRLVTKEEAWPDLRKRLNGTVDLGDLQGIDWLPDSFQVRVADLNQMGAVSAQIRKWSGVDEVVDTHEAAERLVAITKAVQLGGVVAVCFLLIAGAVIIGNTIRLTVHARRREISIMQMVGATNGCIRTPFILEGIFQGMLGALLAIGMLATGYTYLHEEIRQAVPFLEILPPNINLFWNHLGILMGTGLGLGLIGSYFSVRKYLRT